jgi:penicillin amidase
MVVDKVDRGEPAPPAPGPGEPRRRLRRFLKGLALTLVLLLIVGLTLGLRLRSRLAASLPDVDGEARLSGLSAPVHIERDALGVPTLRAANRQDLARALGYVHAQDRFFQMDLVLRRQGAGEVAELLGPPARALDRQVRPLRLRAIARRIWERLPADERALAEAYAAGVNAGLESLDAPPFEYLLLAVEPEPWRPEDTVLAVLTMFQDVQSFTRRYEVELGLMHELLPPALSAFLTPVGTEWDAPIVGEPSAAPSIPGPAAVDLRRLPKVARLAPEPWHGPSPTADPILGGSNAWAIDGRHAAGGRALLANDIHLGHSVPNLWYRASLVWPSADGSGEHRVTGATLPGIPNVVVGSNGHVAWGITTSLTDTSDIVLVDRDAKDPEVYRTPSGPRRFAHHSEPIAVNWGGDETLDVRWTIWGPVLGEDHRGRLRVLRWVAHEPGAVNLSTYRLETAKTVDEALDVARRGGSPAQNLIVADATGRIGWTIMGRLPRRAGFDGRLPASWADGKRRWHGLLPPEEMPRVIDPPAGRLWSANNRMVGGEMLAKLGDGGYRSGARARQIRDRLLALPSATVRDMQAIQLDDRALFLERWRRFLRERVLTPQAVAGHPGRAELRDVVARWEGHAAVDSASYRLVRSFRQILAQQVVRSLAARCREADPQFDYSLYGVFGSLEGALWQLATRQPPHLLDPAYESWQDQFLAVVDQVLAYYEELGDGVPLSRRTWGQMNRVQIRHPMSRFLPLSAGWLDMPARPLPGDMEMPRVQLPNFGATLRMVVSPGREQEGIFHMPAGQSGHPRSAHYRDSHRAWERGEPTPFLPGPPVGTLTLRP